MLSLCLLEDNEKLGNLIYETLNEEGYLCDRFESVEQLPAHTLMRYHIFLVDVTLPGEDGFSFAKKLREMGSVGIIFLTARGTLDDKQEGFGIGADDYLVKPFATKELIMRIESLASRIRDTRWYVFEDVLVDWKSRDVKKNNTAIHLTPIEWEVLGYLLRHVGLVCQRADIIEEVRGTDQLFSMSRSLDVTIAHLRKKLSKDMIETVTGIGYKVVRE